MVKHFTLAVVNPDGTVTLTVYKSSAQEEVCKAAIANKDVLVFQAFPDQEDDELFTYKTVRVLDPVLVQPPAPDPFLKYDIQVEG